ncbi:unnamed protein product [Sphenostylis stenocarpa]|uniref:Mur ligase central domain-containing protein n=1 Tax=Sphenostylis stenocarpa TaxID=92480 RepID=A0AA86VUU2_9FABA|nr:unnamed protein product [Sphenostylis stenocarpa]
MPSPVFLDIICVLYLHLMNVSNFGDELISLEMYLTLTKVTDNFTNQLYNRAINNTLTPMVATAYCCRCRCRTAALRANPIAGSNCLPLRIIPSDVPLQQFGIASCDAHAANEHRSRNMPLSSIRREFARRVGHIRTFSSNLEMKDFLGYLDSLKNYEKSGVPRGAGTESDEGFDLGRMRRLMERFGNPHTKFKAVHIAGTKGKGSTAAYISNILRTEGRSGNPVSAKLLNDLFHRMKAELDQAMQEENGCISHFEVFTTMAFILFADENVDIAVIEAGLGGARDATNIISSSQLAAAVITTVGEEHLAALGGSLETIAMAKAGIIKQGRPVRCFSL